MVDKVQISISDDFVEFDKPVKGIATKDSDADYLYVTKGWVTKYVQEAVAEALAAYIKPEPIVVAPAPQPPKPVDVKPKPDPLAHPAALAYNRKTFLAAIDAIRVGKAIAGADGRYRIELTEDIDMTDDHELVIQNLKDTTIIGNGHKFYRTKLQLQYRMFNIVNSHSISFIDVKFTDGNDGIYGKPGSTPQMILIQRCSEIEMDHVYVSDSKGYAIYVRETKGFKFTNSEMERSGILGLYVGHNFAQQSTGVIIEDNHFHDNATNAVALQGVSGEMKNSISRNVFERNHKYGRWAVAAKYGTGYTGGGQLYLAHVDNLIVTKNKITEGECLNCIDKSNKKVKNVTGIELSGQNDDVITVQNVVITDNDISGNDGKGIGQNLRSKIAKSVQIYDNRVSGNGQDFSVFDVPAS